MLDFCTIVDGQNGSISTVNMDPINMRPLLFLVNITLVEAPNNNFSAMMKGPIYLVQACLSHQTAIPPLVGNT